MSTLQIQTVRNLIDQGLPLFRTGISELISLVRTAFINSEGATSSGTVPAQIANFAVDVFNRVFNIVNTLLPNQYTNILTTINTWADYAGMLLNMESFEDALREVFKLNWLEPVSQMIMLHPQGTMDVSTWFNKLLRHEDTTDLARKAQTFLDNYLSVVLVSPKNGMGGAESLVPIAEPGIRAITSGTSDGFNKMAKKFDLNTRFFEYIQDTLDTVFRIKPSNLIVSGDSIFMNKYVKQLLPNDWYTIAYILIFNNQTASSRLVDRSSFQFGLNYNFVGNTVSFTKTISSNGNLVISPGMDYYLNLSVLANVIAAVMTATVSVTLTSGSNSQTVVIPTAIGFSSLSFNNMLLSQVTNGDTTITWTIAISSTAALPNNTILTILTADTIMVAYPFDREQSANAIVARQTGNAYLAVVASDTWSDYYGNLIIDNSLIDEDLSLVGYIDNFQNDEMSFKAVIEVLQLLNEQSKFEMQVVSPESTKFQAAYLGTDGMKTLITDLADKGPSAFLWNEGIFNSTGGGVPVSLSEQMYVFERFTDILKTLLNLYNFADEEVVRAVKKVLDPSTL